MTKKFWLQQKLYPKQNTLLILLGLVLFFSLFFVTGVFAASTIYEAEDATLSGVTAANTYTGYTGTGYADYGTTNGEYIEWTVTVAAAGSATLDFRYANGSGADIPLELSVNGTVASPNLSFVPTTDWTTWGTVSTSASLNAGSNTIRLTSIVNDGSNIDNLTVVDSAPAVFQIPHGDFLAHTNRCAACHRTHMGQSEGLLYSSPGGNEFCFTCHDGTGAQLVMLSTHGNADFDVPFEATFTLLCTQCHDPHGTANLADIKETIVVVPGLSLVTDGTVNFSSLTGANSFDDGASPYNTRLCTVCHNNTSNVGYPMNNHLGGANHLGGYDLTGQDCTTCHPHSADNTLNNSDGFMPVDGCVMCHSVAQDNGDSVPIGGRRAITPEFGNTSHHVIGVQVSDSDCKACHYNADHTSGYVKVYDADNPGTVITLNGDPRTNQVEAAKLEAFCLACHDANGANGFAPFSNGSMPPVVDVTLWNAGAHKASGSSTCFDCHDNGHGSNKIKIMAPYDAVGDGNPSDPLRQEERFCYQCHDGSVAAVNVEINFGQTSHHNVSDLDQADGSKVECANCHNPHFVNNSAKLSNPDNGALWSGNMTDFCQTCHDGAPPATVLFAGGGAGNAISTHANVDVTAVEANFTSTCNQCHAPHGTNNLSLIKPQVQVTVGPPMMAGPVTLSARTGLNSFDDGTNSGICVVCHINGSNPGFPTVNHPGGAGHSGGMDFTSTDCIQCHPHNVDTDSLTLDGFMSDPKCTGCHQFPMGTRRQVTGAGGDFTNTSHHVQGTPNDSDCELCHEMTQHQAGTVRLFNVDTGAVIPYTGGAIPEVFCTACHDANGANGDTTPYSDGVAVPDILAGWGTSSHAIGLTCFDCHDNGHGSNKQGLLSIWNAVSDGDPNDPMVQEERFCYQCHDGNPAATDIQTEFNRSSHHDVALTDQVANGAKVECINCHNPHMDNATNQNISPDNWYQQWAGRRVDLCLACHDGAPPTVTGGPAPAVSLPAAWSGTGYNKSTYVSSTHDANLSAWGCSHCHDEHGFNNLSMLLENYTIADFTPYTYGNNDYSICWSCHIEADIVESSGGTRADNAFEDLHEKHVNGENSPCIHCHDAHSPFDAGEAGLIDLVYGVNNMDIDLNGETHSSTFWISGNTGSCSLFCHGENHNPLDYNRTATNPASTTTCTTCHPGGPPPP